MDADAQPSTTASEAEEDSGGEMDVVSNDSPGFSGDTVPQIANPLSTSFLSAVPSTASVVLASSPSTSSFLRQPNALVAPSEHYHRTRSSRLRCCGGDGVASSSLRRATFSGRSSNRYTNGANNTSDSPQHSSRRQQRVASANEDDEEDEDDDDGDDEDDDEEVEEEEVPVADNGLAESDDNDDHGPNEDTDGGRHSMSLLSSLSFSSSISAGSMSPSQLSSSASPFGGGSGSPLPSSSIGMCAMNVQHRRHRHKLKNRSFSGGGGGACHCGSRKCRDKTLRRSCHITQCRRKTHVQSRQSMDKEIAASAAGTSQQQQQGTEQFDQALNNINHEGIPSTSSVVLISNPTAPASETAESSQTSHGSMGTASSNVASSSSFHSVFGSGNWGDASFVATDSLSQQFDNTFSNSNNQHVPDSMQEPTERHDFQPCQYGAPFHNNNGDDSLAEQLQHHHHHHRSRRKRHRRHHHHRHCRHRRHRSEQQGIQAAQGLELEEEEEEDDDEPLHQQQPELIVNAEQRPIANLIADESMAEPAVSSNAAAVSSSAGDVGSRVSFAFPGPSGSVASSSGQGIVPSADYHIARADSAGPSSSRYNGPLPSGSFSLDERRPAPIPAPLPPSTVSIQSLPSLDTAANNSNNNNNIINSNDNANMAFTMQEYLSATSTFPPSLLDLSASTVAATLTFATVERRYSPAPVPTPVVRRLMIAAFPRSVADIRRYSAPAVVPSAHTPIGGGTQDRTSGGTSLLSPLTPAVMGPVGIPSLAGPSSAHRYGPSRYLSQETPPASSGSFASDRFLFPLSTATPSLVGSLSATTGGGSGFDGLLSGTGIGGISSFSEGVRAIESGCVEQALQIGFHLNGIVRSFGIPEGDRKRYKVALSFDRCKIISVSCSCDNSDIHWCHHVVALSVFRIQYPDRVTLRLPISETLYDMDRNQLQKLVQYLIAEHHVDVLPTAQYLADNILKPTSTINAIQGAPDPTAGPEEYCAQRWYLDEAQIAQVVISQLSHTSSMEQIQALFDKVREMLQSRDENGPRLLEVITEQIITYPWMSGDGASSSVRSGPSSSTSAATSHSEKCQQLWDQIRLLWVSVMLNPYAPTLAKANWRSRLLRWSAVSWCPPEMPSSHGGSLTTASGHLGMAAAAMDFASLGAMFFNNNNTASRNNNARGNNHHASSSSGGNSRHSARRTIFSLAIDAARWQWSDQHLQHNILRRHPWSSRRLGTTSSSLRSSSACASKRCRSTVPCTKPHHSHHGHHHHHHRHHHHRHDCKRRKHGHTQQHEPQATDAFQAETLSRERSRDTSNSEGKSGCGQTTVASSSSMCVATYPPPLVDHHNRPYWHEPLVIACSRVECLRTHGYIAEAISLALSIVRTLKFWQNESEAMARRFVVENSVVSSAASGNNIMPAPVTGHVGVPATVHRCPNHALPPPQSTVSADKVSQESSVGTVVKEVNAPSATGSCNCHANRHRNAHGCKRHREPSGSEKGRSGKRCRHQSRSASSTSTHKHGDPGGAGKSPNPVTIKSSETLQERVPQIATEDASGRSSIVAGSRVVFVSEAPPPMPITALASECVVVVENNSHLCNVATKPNMGEDSKQTQPSREHGCLEPGYQCGESIVLPSVHEKRAKIAASAATVGDDVATRQCAMPSHVSVDNHIPPTICSPIQPSSSSTNSSSVVITAQPNVASSNMAGSGSTLISKDHSFNDSHSLLPTVTNNVGSCSSSVPPQSHRSNEDAAGSSGMQWGSCTSSAAPSRHIVQPPMLFSEHGAPSSVSAVTAMSTSWLYYQCPTASASGNQNMETNISRGGTHGIMGDNKGPALGSASSSCSINSLKELNHAIISNGGSRRIQHVINTGTVSVPTTMTSPASTSGHHHRYHQHRNYNEALSLSQASGIKLPKAWGSLCGGYNSYSGTGSGANSDVSSGTSGSSKQGTSAAGPSSASSSNPPPSTSSRPGTSSSNKSRSSSRSHHHHQHRQAEYGWIGQILDPINCLLDTLLYAHHYGYAEQGRSIDGISAPSADGNIRSGRRDTTYICAAIEAVMIALGQQRSLPPSTSSYGYLKVKAIKQEESLIGKLRAISLDPPLIRIIKKQTRKLLDGSGTWSALASEIPPNTAPMHTFAGFLFQVLLSHDPDLAYEVGLRAMKQSVADEDMGDSFLNSSTHHWSLPFGHLESQQSQLASALLIAARDSVFRLNTVLTCIQTYVRSSSLVYRLAQEVHRDASAQPEHSSARHHLMTTAVELGLQVLKMTLGSPPWSRGEMVRWLVGCAIAHSLETLLSLISHWHQYFTPGEAAGTVAQLIMQDHNATSLSRKAQYHQAQPATSSSAATGTAGQGQSLQSQRSPHLNPRHREELSRALHRLAYECVLKDPTSCARASLSMSEGDRNAFEQVYNVIYTKAQQNEMPADEIFKTAKHLEFKGYARCAFEFALLGLSKLRIGHNDDTSPLIGDIYWSIELAFTLGKLELTKVINAVVLNVKCAPVLSDLLRKCFIAAPPGLMIPPQPTAGLVAAAPLSNAAGSSSSGLAQGHSNRSVPHQHQRYPHTIGGLSASASAPSLPTLAQQHVAAYLQQRHHQQQQRQQHHGAQQWDGNVASSSSAQSNKATAYHAPATPAVAVEDGSGSPADAAKRRHLQHQQQQRQHVEQSSRQHQHNLPTAVPQPPQGIVPAAALMASSASAYVVSAPCNQGDPFAQLLDAAVSCYVQTAQARLTHISPRHYSEFIDFLTRAQETFHLAQDGHLHFAQLIERMKSYYKGKKKLIALITQRFG